VHGVPIAAGEGLRHRVAGTVVHHGEEELGDVVLLVPVVVVRGREGWLQSPVSVDGPLFHSTLCEGAKDVSECLADRRRRGEGRRWQGDVDRWYEEEGLGDGVNVTNVGAVVEACRSGVAARSVPLRFSFPGGSWLRWVFPVLRPNSVSWPGDSSLLRRRVRLGPFRDL